MSDDHQLEAVKIAGEWNKQLTLWATGAVVLSISFMKDILQGISLGRFWRCELIASWTVLLASTVFGILAFGGPITGAGESTFKLGVNKPTRKLSQIQAVLFISGIAGLVIFGGFNLPDRLSSEKADGKANPGQQFRIFRSAAVQIKGFKHSHTFLVDQSTGETWEMRCSGKTVEFHKILVEGLPSQTISTPK